MNNVGKKVKIMFLMFFFIKIASSQTVETAYRFANEQFILKNYEVAELEYQRVLFFESEKYNLECYLKLAEIANKKKESETALKYLNFAYNATKNDSLKNNILIKKAEIFIFNKKFINALTEIDKIPDSNYDNLQNTINFYKGICFFGIEDFELAEKFFIAVLDSSETEKIAEIEKIFSKSKKFNSPNPEIAFVASMAMPGAGQFYAGDYANSLNSLLLSGGLLGLGFYISKVYSKLDAVIVVLPFFYRYYFGGAMQARKFAIRKKEKKRSKEFQKIIEICQKF